MYCLNTHENVDIFGWPLSMFVNICIHFPRTSICLSALTSYNVVNMLSTFKKLKDYSHHIEGTIRFRNIH